MVASDYTLVCLLPNPCSEVLNPISAKAGSKPAERETFPLVPSQQALVWGIFSALQRNPHGGVWGTDGC